MKYIILGLVMFLVVTWSSAYVLGTLSVFHWAKPAILVTQATFSVIAVFLFVCGIGNWLEGK